MDEVSAPETNLHRWIKSAVRSLIVSAIAVAALCFAESDSVKPVFEALSAFTPATVWSLIADANTGCGPQGAARPSSPQWGGPSQSSPITVSPLIGSPAHACAAPLVDNWPAVGQWRTRWLDVPGIGDFIALADVTIHLLVPTTVKGPAARQTVIGFMSLLLLVFGFGFAGLVLKRVAKRLDDVSLLLLTVILTLLTGSLVFWAVAHVVTAIFAFAEHLTGNVWIATIAATAGTYAGGITILKLFLEKRFHAAVPGPVDSASDRVAHFIIRYLP